MKKSQGYTLLFSILITSLVMSVSLSILSIARKEVILSSAALESQVAIFTADTAMECAIYWDSKLAFATTTSATTTITCNGTSPSDTDNVYVSPSGAASPSGAYNFSFVIPFPSGGTTENRCASVLVLKDIEDGFRTTRIIARGYNVGYNDIAANPECTRLSTKKVERAIEFEY